jgi:hypothetical protein
MKTAGSRAPAEVVARELTPSPINVDERLSRAQAPALNALRGMTSVDSFGGPYLVSKLTLKKIRIRARGHKTRLINSDWLNQLFKRNDGKVWRNGQINYIE